MRLIQYGTTTHSYDELKNGSPQTNQAMIFCSDWLNQKQTFIINTSGSTGKPKPIELKRNMMAKSAAMTIDALDLYKSQKSLVCLNTEYIAGKMMLVRSLEMGMDITIVNPSSNPLKELPGNSTFDFAAFVPLQLETILRETPEKITILNSMKAIIIGGAALNSYLEDKVQSINAPVYHSFGMTETISHIALRRLNGNERSDYFKTLEGVSVSLDERGCLVIKSPFDNNLITTNDMVEIKNSEYFKWIGRIDNVINSGGLKIHPEKIESSTEKIFYTLGINNRFFIAGMPHSQLGHTANLFIEGNTPDDSIQEKIKNELANNLPKYEVPKAIFFIQSFKETPTGKIDRLSTLKSLS